MNQDHRYLVEQFQQLERPRTDTGQRPEHLGTPRIWYGLKNAERRQILLDWIADHKDLSYDDWLALCDLLYHGVSYEERCASQTLLAKFPQHRRQLPLSQFDNWLELLEGWAEVDSTCQSIFNDKDLLSDWDSWQVFLEALAQDENINKRRASLVLLVRPVSKSSDERLISQALANAESLKHEKDKLITKAISWILREAVKLHRDTIETYLDSNAESLPAIAVRETRQKLATGKK